MNTQIPFSQHTMKTTNFDPIEKHSVKKLSDSELYSLCKKYGSLSLEARRKFAGLLPEVYRRKLYRRRGFASIHEFAAKLAGMSKESVNKILNLSKKLEGKPELKTQLETGSQGWSKIERVAYIATPENDKELANKVETLSSEALKIYVKELHNKEDKNCIFNREESTANGELKDSKQDKKENVWRRINFPIAPETENALRLFMQKHKCLTFNEALIELMKIASSVEKNKANSQIQPKFTKKNLKNKKITRHIPTNIKRIIQAKYKGFCAFPNCCKPATSLHHTKRFALEKKHDPEKIIPLCTAHERLAHAGLIKNEDNSPETWSLQKEPDKTDHKYYISNIGTHSQLYG